MKKYIGLLVLLFIGVSLLIAGVTNFPNGLAIGTEAQEATADVTPGDGDVYVVGTLETDGAIDFGGTFTQDGIHVREVSAVQNISTTTALTVTDSVMIIKSSNATQGGSASIWNTATPFISTTSVATGTEVILIGTNDTLYLRDNSVISGSQFELDGSTYALGTDCTLWLMYYGEKWIQIGGTNIED